ITGIEIEEKAAHEAARNASNSPWSHRIKILNAALQDFEQEQTCSFDLIVSNPPFFSNSKKPESEMLAMAKHNHLLPYPDLMACSARLLTRNGRIALIVPADSAAAVVQLALNMNLCLLRETEVKPNNIKKTHRFLLEFGKSKPQSIEREVLIIHNDDGKDYTDQYKELTRPFYLCF